MIKLVYWNIFTIYFSVYNQEIIPYYRSIGIRSTR